VCRKFTSITEEDHCSIFDPVEQLMKLTTRLCIAVCNTASIVAATLPERMSFKEITTKNVGVVKI